MKLTLFRSIFNLKALSFGLGDSDHKYVKPTCIAHMSHAHHVIEYKPSVRGHYVDRSEALDLGSILVRREQICHLDLWLFGVCDDGVGTAISGYLGSHLFDKKPKEVMSKCRESLRKAYVNARGNCEEGEKGSASAFVMNGDKIVIASMGGYRAVVCRDGVASTTKTTFWPRKLILGALCRPKARAKVCTSLRSKMTRSWRNSKIAISSQKLDSSIEFIILGSPGVWEVMKNQEAVNLIWNIEDAQKAAECLAREAMARMTRSNISCLVIRFD